MKNSSFVSSYGTRVGFTALLLCAYLPATRCLAQDASASDATPALEDIVVTARKRDESILRTPVLVQAVSATQIRDLHITNVYELQSAVPGLSIAPAFGSVGSTANLRGLGNGQAANYIDQSVGLNVDGIGVSSGQFLRGGLFDLAQLEVLRGPQALFFGKSTSAGVIALHTANPTSVWDAQVRTAHEFDADEMDYEGFVSGPITDTLGVRLAAYYNEQSGWFVNPNPETIGGRRVPNGHADGVRLTLKYDSEFGLHANFKTSYNQVKDNAASEYTHQDICATGTSSIPAYNAFDTRCRFNRYTDGDPNPKPYVPGTLFPPFDPAPFANAWPNPLYGDGRADQFTDTTLSSLNLDYGITPDLKLSSITGYSHYKVGEALGSETPKLGFFGLADRSFLSEYSQELRLASSFNGWFNFMVGGLYDRSRRRDNLDLTLPSFGIYSYDLVALHTTNTSGFAQIVLTPIEKWELTLGARYNKVKKTFVSAVSVNNYTEAFPPTFTNNSGQQQIQNIPRANRHFSENATTPEVTVTFRPTEDVTTFASFKKGYKGPGFNFSLTDVVFSEASASPFTGERAKGVEGGIKARLLDRHLALTLTGYRYNYTGLQVAIPSNTTVLVKPDANARVQGFEFGADFAPIGLENLTLSAFGNYNDSHYTRWTDAPCWSGQLPSQGCTVDPVSGNSSQDLSGSTLSLAPRWSGNFGATYKFKVSDAYYLSTNIGGTVSSRYNAVPEQNPNGQNGSYVTLDAGLRFGRSDDGWDIAVLGRNLTSRLYATTGQDRDVLAPAGIPGDAALGFARPWQVLLQLSVRPAKLYQSGWL